MPRSAQRQDRINIRLSPQAKRTLERAATYSEKTLTDFVVESALNEAEAIVREREVIALSPEQWEHFQEALLNPGKPDGKLAEALAEHARVVVR